MSTARKVLFGMSVIVLFQSTSAIAIMVSSTVFEGSTYSLITDNSGNEWLSLLATDGQTYNFVESRINNNVGDYAKYHFATQPAVVALFGDYGAPDINIGPTNANVASATALQADFGSTGAISVGEPLTWGYTSSILVQGSNSFPNFHVSPFVKVQTFGGEAEFRTTLSVDVISGTSQHLRGSWLIRNAVVAPVPVPSTIWLFGSGVIGLVGVMRRRSINK